MVRTPLRLLRGPRMCPCGPPLPAKPVVRPPGPLLQAAAQRDVHPPQHTPLLPPLPVQLPAGRNQREQMAQQLARGENKEECRKEEGGTEDTARGQTLWRGASGVYLAGPSQPLRRLQLRQVPLQEPPHAEGYRRAIHPQGVPRGKSPWRTHKRGRRRRAHPLGSHTPVRRPRTGNPAQGGGAGKEGRLEEHHPRCGRNRPEQGPGDGARICRRKTGSHEPDPLVIAQETQGMR